MTQQEAHKDGGAGSADEHLENDSATGAGSESPEEGKAAMDAAEDATKDSGD